MSCNQCKQTPGWWAAQESICLKQEALLLAGNSSTCGCASLLPNALNMTHTEKHGPPTRPWETDHMPFAVELGNHRDMRKLRVSMTSSSTGQVVILQIYSCFSTKHFWSKTWGFRFSSWFGLSYPKPVASWPLFLPLTSLEAYIWKISEYGAMAFISVFMTHLLMLQLLAMY